MRRGAILWALAASALISVQAHRLSIEWEVRDGTLSLAAFMGNEPAAGAMVQFRTADGALLETGTLDPQGQYHWDWPGDLPLAIEVDGGLGHRRTLTLTEADLTPAPAPPTDPVRPSPAPANDDRPVQAAGSTDTAFSTPVRVGLGLTFLLALTAAWTSYRNHRRLDALERRFR